MALVAYDYSDDSDDNEPVNVASTTKILVDGPVSRDEVHLSTSSNFALPAYSSKDADENDGDVDSNSSYSDDDRPIDISFSTLPKPQYDTLYVDESKLKTAKSGIWKKFVSIPRVDKTTVRKKQASSSRTNSEKSGLLSLLPNPIGESTKTTGSTISNTKLLPTVIGNKMKPKQTAGNNENVDEDSDSDTDFFSLSKIGKDPEYDISSVDLDMIVEPLNDVNILQKQKVISEDTSRVNEVSEYFCANHLTNGSDESVSDMNPNPESQSRLHLDEDAVLKLCGRKRKGQVPDDIQIIDIHEDSVLAETRKNLTKHLTEEVSYRPMRSGPSTLSKRKHQITYLAFQAKERELELKNQWANNRFNKKQTQSKYGF